MAEPEVIVPVPVKSSKKRSRNNKKKKINESIEDDFECLEDLMENSFKLDSGK